MSDMGDDETRATKLLNGSMKITELLDYWHIEHEIPLYEIDAVKDYIKKLEGEYEIK